MPRYFFDTRDGEIWLRDEIGVELDGIDKARGEATAGLADMAKELIPGAVRKEIAVEVRDAAGRSLIRATVQIEVDLL